MISVLELIGLLISVPSFLYFLCIVYKHAESHCTAFRLYRRTLDQAESALNSPKEQFHALHNEIHTYPIVLSQSDYPITLLPAVDHQFISTFINDSLAHLAHTKTICQSKGILSNIRNARRIYRQSDEMEKPTLHLTFYIHQTMKTCCLLLQFTLHDYDAAIKLVTVSTSQEFHVYVSSKNTQHTLTHLSPHSRRTQLSSICVKHTPEAPFDTTLDFTMRLSKGTLEPHIFSDAATSSHVFAFREAKRKGPGVPQFAKPCTQKPYHNSIYGALEKMELTGVHENVTEPL